MKKLTAILAILILTSGCTINTGGFSPSTLNQGNEKYYCPEIQSENSYSINNLYVPRDNCESMKNKFVKSISPNAYEDCINKNIKLKARYDEGKCEKVIIKQHRIGGAKCTVEVTENSKKIISKSCFGRNTDYAMRKLNSIYK